MRPASLDSYVCTNGDKVVDDWRSTRGLDGISSITYDDNLSPEEVFTSYVTSSWESITMAFIQPMYHRVSNTIPFHNEQKSMFHNDFTLIINKG